MKRRVVCQDDWNYTEDNDMSSFKELMSENMSHQEDGEVGIFWYDTEQDDLFGVRSASVEDVPFYKSNLFNTQVKTCRPLHYKIWEKEYHRGRDKRFRGDYTLVPRGRIFYVKDRGFVVVVGDWIDDYPTAKELIIDEFNLPADAEFQKDIHWNIGHGWSDKFM